MRGTFRVSQRAHIDRVRRRRHHTRAVWGTHEGVMIVRSSGALGSVLWTVVALTLTIGCSSERHSRAKPAERGAARAEEPDAAVSGTGSDAAPDSAGQDAAPDPAGMAGEPRKA